MYRPPADQFSTEFQQNYQAILAELDDYQSIERHKDEIFATCYASPFIKRVCTSQPLWLQRLLDNDELHIDYVAGNYIELLEPVFSQASTVEELQRLLRRVRVTEFARIAWRDLQRYATVQQTLSELSAFAEVCIDRTLLWCFEWLQSRPRAGQFERHLPQRIVIFALGKLGGHELNFSSDVDIVFAYSDAASYSQDQRARAVSFYVKSVQLLIKVLSEQTRDGFVFRVDTRLRPFGKSGTLLPSISAIDQYFQTHGRDWERYAWIKARAIAGDVHAGEQFLKEVTPFVYRRYLDYGVVQSLREMKALVDEKARRDAAKVDIKIGPGGIREIEFIVQMFQLIYGGRNANLRTGSTLESLQYLGELEMLSNENITHLKAAYLFLRKAENSLQLRDDQQTYILPSQVQEQAHYAYLMNATDWDEVYTEYVRHTSNVNKVFQFLLQTDADGDEKSTAKNADFARCWQRIDDRQYCIEILAGYFNADTENVYKRLMTFSSSSVVQQLMPLARQRLDAFMPVFLQHTLHVEKRVLIIDRFLGILNKIVRRSTYVSLLTESQNKLKRLLTLIESSQWIARYISTHPLLLDTVLPTDDFYEPPSLHEMRRQLKASFGSSDGDLEKYMEGLREFKHAQVLQIAAADAVEALPVMQISDHLSWLADICVNSAVQWAYQDLVSKYGEPVCVNNGETFLPELLIVAYGKLGGLELGYGSDLDIVFMHNSEGVSCETNVANKIHNDVFFTRLVQRAIHLLTTATAAGKAFDIDVRLRPYSQSGPIVTSMRAYENYLRHKAWLWELQALIRARALTDNRNLADHFASIRQDLLCQSRHLEAVRKSITEMRQKMLAEHGSKDKSKFNIKKDAGGLIDIEFIVQFYVLGYASKHADICVHTDNVRILDACSEANLIRRESAQELKSIYLDYRKRLHQLSLQLLPETVEANEFTDERSAVQHYWTSLLH